MSRLAPLIQICRYGVGLFGVELGYPHRAPVNWSALSAVTNLPHEAEAASVTC